MHIVCILRSRHRNRSASTSASRRAMAGLMPSFNNSSESIGIPILHSIRRHSRIFPPRGHASCAPSKPIGTTGALERFSNRPTPGLKSSMAPSKHRLPSGKSMTVRPAASSARVSRIALLSRTLPLSGRTPTDRRSRPKIGILKSSSLARGRDGRSRVAIPQRNGSRYDWWLHTKRTGPSRGIRSLLRTR